MLVCAFFLQSLNPKVDAGSCCWRILHRVGPAMRHVHLKAEESLSGSITHLTWADVLASIWHHECIEAHSPPLGWMLISQHPWDFAFPFLRDIMNARGPQAAWRWRVAHSFTYTTRRRRSEQFTFSYVPTLLNLLFTEPQATRDQSGEVDRWPATCKESKLALRERGWESERERESERETEWESERVSEGLCYVVGNPRYLLFQCLF